MNNELKLELNNLNILIRKSDEVNNNNINITTIPGYESSVFETIKDTAKYIYKLIVATIKRIINFIKKIFIKFIKFIKRLLGMETKQDKYLRLAESYKPTKVIKFFEETNDNINLSLGIVKDIYLGMDTTKAIKYINTQYAMFNNYKCIEDTISLINELPNKINSSNIETIDNEITENLSLLKKKIYVNDDYIIDYFKNNNIENDNVIIKLIPSELQYIDDTGKLNNITTIDNKYIYAPLRLNEVTLIANMLIDYSDEINDKLKYIDKLNTNVIKTLDNVLLPMIKSINNMDVASERKQSILLVSNDTINIIIKGLYSSVLNGAQELVNTHLNVYIEESLKLHKGTSKEWIKYKNNIPTSLSLRSLQYGVIA